MVGYALYSSLIPHAVSSFVPRKLEEPAHNLLNMSFLSSFTLIQLSWRGPDEIVYLIEKAKIGIRHCRWTSLVLQGLQALEGSSFWWQQWHTL